MLASKGELQMSAMAPLVALVLLAGAVIAPAGAGSRVTDITVEQARELIQQRSGRSDFVILDVRTPAEFTEGHIRGAINLDISAPELERRLGALDRGKSYLVYCRTGNRSLRAVQAMERLGFRTVYHMNQGIVAWQQKKLPLSRPS
jgi:rhodanese-related sulfurtransferase